MKFRAFISADIAPNERLVSLLRQLAMSRADLKVVRPELLHVTLKFLGDTEEGMVNQIEELIKDCTKGVPPFTVRLRGMGAFPSMSNIRVVWVGMEDAQPLGEIAKRLDDSLKALGFETDTKGFKPHLTLARTRSPRNIANLQDIIKENAASDFGNYPVRSVHLKKSVLNPQGPTYSVVREIML